MIWEIFAVSFYCIIVRRSGILKAPLSAISIQTFPSTTGSRGTRDKNLGTWEHAPRKCRSGSTALKELSSCPIFPVSPRDEAELEHTAWLSQPKPDPRT